MSQTVGYLATVLLILGVAQLFAGAGGVEPVCVRVGQVLCSLAGLGFVAVVVLL